MKFLKKASSCFFAVTLTTFVCLWPTMAPAFAESYESDNPAVAASASEAPTDVQESSDANEVTDSSDDSTENSADEAHAADESLNEVASTDESAAVEQAEQQADPNTFNVSTGEEFATAMQKINATASGEYTININSDITASGDLQVAANRTVNLVGNGHSVTLADGATFGTNGGTLNLGNGSAFTVTSDGALDHSAVMVSGGTLNMYDGAIITGNNAGGTSNGGGVSVLSKGTFNMNGGVIENCQAAKGGGVYIDRNTKFTMSGNAIIRDNRALNVGGGVYVNNRATFTMEGNASVVENAADAAGGVMNYGLATLTTVYNNTTHNGAADIFNNGRMKLSPTNPDWVLSSTGTHVTGWYIDNYSATDEDGNQGDGNHRWNPAADDSVEYTPTDGVTTQTLYLVAGAPLPEEPTINVIWENYDGTVLYSMSDVDADDVPAADEYTVLSGNANPTEPADSTNSYAFEGWEQTTDEDGDVIYIAEYEPTAPAIVPDQPLPNPGDQEDVVDGPDPIQDTPAVHDDDNAISDGDDQTEQSAKDAAGMVRTGDNGMPMSLAAASGMLAGLAGLLMIRRQKANDER